MKVKDRKYDRLRVELYARRITLQDVAQTLGVVSFTVREKLDGKRDFYCGEAELISEKYGIPIDYFFADRCLNETEAGTP